MYVIGGLVLMIPVQPTVKVLGASRVPQLTRVGGTGAVRVPGANFILLI